VLVETRPATSDSSVVTPETFRRVMAQVPTSVTVVAAMTGQGPVGLTVGTFVSASLEPPLIGFLPARSSTTWPLIVPIGEFCVSVLADGHEELGQRFARSGGPKFDGVRWHPAPSGAPIIDGALAWFDCRFERSFSAGDHWFVLGRVRAMALNSTGRPLVFCQGSLRPLATDANDNVRKDD
jgi:3-hydroxy-9,10-secoandrosta-1,3,5(10)-triene-9,17-dione monooxygenase reductase component